MSGIRAKHASACGTHICLPSLRGGLCLLPFLCVSIYCSSTIQNPVIDNSDLFDSLFPFWPKPVMWSSPESRCRDVYCPVEAVGEGRGRTFEQGVIYHITDVQNGAHTPRCNWNTEPSTGPGTQQELPMTPDRLCQQLFLFLLSCRHLPVLRVPAGMGKAHQACGTSQGPSSH